MCPNKQILAFSTTYLPDKKILALDKINNQQGYIILLSQEELEQYNSVHKVTDSNRLVNQIN